MRILYVGNFAKDDPTIGTCPNADYISDTFEELGHSVKRLNECEYVAKEILEELENGYDLLLTEEARLKGDFKSDENLNEDKLLGLFEEVMENTDTPIVVWLTNLFFGIMRREIQVQTNPIFKADIVFTTDGGHQKEFEKFKVNHHLLRQGIYQKEAYITEPKYETNSEIGFIGGMYENIWPYRKKLVDWLYDTYGTKFEHFGLSGEIRHHELNELCATLKIIVGDSVYSPNYWSNRIYEILGRGGFLIHPKTPGLDEEFTAYKHYIPYRMGDFKGLQEIIDYYLTHDEEREKIRMAGFEHCKKNHTYLHRVKELLRVLEQEKII